MRILNVIQRYPPAIGGSETWCQEVCRHLARRGHDVRVLTLEVNKEEHFWNEPADAERTVAFGRLGFDDGVWVRRYRRSLPIHTFHHQVLKELLDETLKFHFFGPHSEEMYGRMWREIARADLVFLHTVPYPHNYVAFVLARLFGKRTAIVPHFHPTHPHYERSWHYWLMANCDAVITVTEFEKRYLAERGILPERIHVTGNALHPEEYLPQGLEEFREKLGREHGFRPEDAVVTFLGRKTPEKGVEHLIQAARRLLQSMPLTLFLVGPRFDWYDRLYEGLPEAERQRIIDLGVLSQQEKVNLLHLSDLLALPSRYEAFGIVFLEAWLCGAAVLGTTEGAMPSVIGEEGFLSRFGDVDHLTETLRDALASRETLKRIGERGRAKVLANYTWDAIGRKAEAALQAAHGGGKPRLKVLLATNAYPPRFIGGAEIIAHQQVKALVQLGHEVLVFAGLPDGSVERHSVRRDTYEGVPVVRVCLHPRDYSSDFFVFYHKPIHDLFDQVVEEFAPDVIHLHNIMGLSASLIQAAARRNVRTVLTLHDYWGFCHKNTMIKDGDLCTDFKRCAECMPFVNGEHWNGVPVRMRKDYVEYQLRKVDALVSPSSYLAGQYTRAGFEKVQVVWNGINVDRLSQVKRTDAGEKVRFTFVGYLGRHKGVHTILEALPLLAAWKSRVRVNLVGEGDQKENFKSRAQEDGWAEQVRFWGKIDNARIEEVYQETDVLILPSIWPENQPVTITEAMAARIPVIGSRMGGIPELVEDGRTGFLFEAGDATGLAHQMARFVEQPALAVEMGAAAFEKIRVNTFRNQVGKLVEIYGAERDAANSRSGSEFLALCWGKKLVPGVDDAIRRFEARSTSRAYFFLADWLEDSEIANGRVLWVIDESARMADVAVGLRNQLPLLVPASCEALRELCVRGQCGLYYRDMAEAAECLKYLAENDQARQALGRNAFRAFYARRAAFSAPVQTKARQTVLS